MDRVFAQHEERHGAAKATSGANYCGITALFNYHERVALMLGSSDAWDITGPDGVFAEDTDSRSPSPGRIAQLLRARGVMVDSTGRWNISIVDRCV
jgi:hypothetical protein